MESLPMDRRALLDESTDLPSAPNQPPSMAEEELLAAGVETWRSLLASTLVTEPL
jgi:hypothetical protein